MCEICNGPRWLDYRGVPLCRECLEKYSKEALCDLLRLPTDGTFRDAADRKAS